MIRRFFNDRRGNYMLLTAGRDGAHHGRPGACGRLRRDGAQRQETLNALDAAGIATARRIVEGATDEQVKAYAKNFFEANLGSVNPANTTLTVVLPNNNTGGGTLKLTAGAEIQAVFLPTSPC